MSQVINYESLLRDASIEVVKKVLKIIATDGFSNNQQHLYITFSTNHHGVKLADFLKEEDELTIVLQYEFWDLKIDEYGFSVSLAFERSNETIYIPYSALINVSDPSEDFSLSFVPNFKDVKEQVINNQENKIISFADICKNV